MLKLARASAVALGIVAYAVLVHHVNASGQVSLLGAVLALAPVFLLALGMAGNRSSRLLGIVLLLAAAALMLGRWHLVAEHSALIFWLQDLGLMLALMLTFGRTLLAGRKPLCVQFAELMHGELPAAHAHYARQVTVAWVLFFAAMAITSTLLFALAPLTTWSLFANFLTLPLVGVMFAAEYAVRRQVLPDTPAGSIMDGVRAYMHNAAGPAPKP